MLSELAIPVTIEETSLEIKDQAVPMIIEEPSLEMKEHLEVQVEGTHLELYETGEKCYDTRAEQHLCVEIYLEECGDVS